MAADERNSREECEVIAAELQHRTTRRARLLLGQVLARLTGLKEQLQTPGQAPAQRDRQPTQSGHSGSGGGADASAEGMRRRFIEICMKHRHLGIPGVVFAEPHAPFVPPTWNGILVLAIAQNLSGTPKNVEHRQSTSDASPEAKVLRLGTGGKVQVGPWDDGALKLAVEAALSERAGETAVSNAILWSESEDPSKVPGPPLQRASVKVWAEMLPLLRPRVILTAGRAAFDVVRALAKLQGEPWLHVPLRFPGWRFGPRKLPFERARLLSKYPEVERAIQQHPDWLGVDPLRTIVFGCHAVEEAQGRCPDPPKQSKLSFPPLRLGRLGWAER